jgi:uncharacterized protein (DUF302 family)
MTGDSVRWEGIVRVWYFCLVVVVLLAVAANPGWAENPTPYPGTQVIETPKPFDAFVTDLKAAVEANGMAVVAEACATCGAKSIGVTIPGNRVIMIFNPKFAVRMLAGSVPAGIEAPLRLYVTEQQDGNAVLTYRVPSQVFGAYENAALEEMAAELDALLAKIVADAQT